MQLQYAFALGDLVLFCSHFERVDIASIVAFSCFA